MFQTAKLQHKAVTAGTMLCVHIMCLLVRLGTLYVKHWSLYVRCKWARMNYMCNKS